MKSSTLMEKSVLILKNLVRYCFFIVLVSLFFIPNNAFASKNENRDYKFDHELFNLTQICSYSSNEDNNNLIYNLLKQKKELLVVKFFLNRYSHIELEKKLQPIIQKLIKKYSTNEEVLVIMAQNHNDLSSDLKKLFIKNLNKLSSIDLYRNIRYRFYNNLELFYELLNKNDSTDLSYSIMSYLKNQLALSNCSPIDTTNWQNYVKRYSKKLDTKIATSYNPNDSLKFLIETFSYFTNEEKNKWFYKIMNNKEVSNVYLAVFLENNFKSISKDLREAIILKIYKDESVSFILAKTLSSNFKELSLTLKDTLLPFFKAKILSDTTLFNYREMLFNIDDSNSYFINDKSIEKIKLLFVGVSSNTGCNNITYPDYLYKNQNISDSNDITNLSTTIKTEFDSIVNNHLALSYYNNYELKKLFIKNFDFLAPNYQKEIKDILFSTEELSKNIYLFVDIVDELPDGIFDPFFERVKKYNSFRTKVIELFLKKNTYFEKKYDFTKNFQIFLNYLFDDNKITPDFITKISYFFKYDQLPKQMEAKLLKTVSSNIKIYLDLLNKNLLDFSDIETYNKNKKLFSKINLNLKTTKYKKELLFFLLTNYDFLTDEEKKELSIFINSSSDLSLKTFSIIITPSIFDKTYIERFVFKLASQKPKNSNLVLLFYKFNSTASINNKKNLFEIFKSDISYKGKQLFIKYGLSISDSNLKDILNLKTNNFDYFDELIKLTKDKDLLNLIVKEFFNSSTPSQNQNKWISILEKYAPTSKYIELLKLKNEIETNIKSVDNDFIFKNRFHLDFIYKNNNYYEDEIFLQKVLSKNPNLFFDTLAFNSIKFYDFNKATHYNPKLFEKLNILLNSFNSLNNDNPDNNLELSIFFNNNYISKVSLLFLKNWDTLPTDFKIELHHFLLTSFKIYYQDKSVYTSDKSFYRQNSSYTDENIFNNDLFKLINKYIDDFSETSKNALFTDLYFSGWNTYAVNYFLKNKIQKIPESIIKDDKAHRLVSIDLAGFSEEEKIDLLFSNSGYSHNNSLYDFYIDAVKN